MRYPLKKKLRARSGRRLLSSLAWAVFWCAAWLAAIEFFYGPGAAVAESAPMLLGGICAVGAVGILVSFCYLIARLIGFFCFTGPLRRSVRRYLPDGPDDLYGLLESDIRHRLFETTDIYLGSDWILLGGRAMLRDAVAGIFYEDLSQRYLSKKTRLQLRDDRGNSIETDLSPKQSPQVVYRYLVSMHPQAVRGDSRAREGVGAISAYQLYRQGLEERAEAPLGLSAWDKSPILERNELRFDYERWLLASYSLYVAADPYYCGDFTRVAGYERTERQRALAAGVLLDPWEIRDRAELLDTVRHLTRTGRDRRDGWQLGRATMVLGFGYIAELISREELLQYSLDAALAIQQTFSGWQELFDSHMRGFAAWAKRRPAIARRRRVYRALLRDPASPLNTVPFQADLPALCREALSAPER